VNANVAPATHGESVSEIAGSGDAAASSQRFVLKQPPLTWVSDASQPTGRASTLELRVNDLLWHAVPSLYGRGPLERVYTLRQQDDATTAAAFGDGVQGARLPTGQNNVRATYRKGIGAGGNVRAGQISNLVTRPLGVKAAVNPVAASGGQDAETLDAARRSAPLRVLTLDRAVSLADYADFARSFAGIEKACAVWIDDASARGVYVTVAGPGGAAVAENGDTHAHLVDALRRFGDPLLPLSVRTFVSRHVHIEALVKPDPDAVADAVLAAVAAALRAAFAFEARDFGQTVALDEVYAVIQGVPGVIASDVKQLHDSAEAPGALPEPRVFARLPTLQADGSVDAAEILTLEDGPLNLAVMT
jgi:predicted phage baseplate assembly protein